MANGWTKFMHNTRRRGGFAWRGVMGSGREQGADEAVYLCWHFFSSALLITRRSCKWDEWGEDRKECTGGSYGKGGEGNELIIQLPYIAKLCSFDARVASNETLERKVLDFWDIIFFQKKVYRFPIYPACFTSSCISFIISLLISLLLIPRILRRNVAYTTRGGVSHDLAAQPA